MLGSDGVANSTAVVVAVAVALVVVVAVGVAATATNGNQGGQARLQCNLTYIPVRRHSRAGKPIP